MLPAKAVIASATFSSRPVRAFSCWRRLTRASTLRSISPDIDPGGGTPGPTASAGSLAGRSAFAMARPCRRRELRGVERAVAGSIGRRSTQVDLVARPRFDAQAARAQHGDDAGVVRSPPVRRVAGEPMLDE